MPLREIASLYVCDDFGFPDSSSTVREEAVRSGAKPAAFTLLECGRHEHPSAAAAPGTRPCRRFLVAFGGG